MHNVCKTKQNLREFAYYRHPGPRRVWEVVSEPPFLTPLPWLWWFRWFPGRVPKTQILLLFTIL